MLPEAAIPRLLMDYIEGLPGHSPPLRCAFPGLALKPADDEVYIDVGYLPNQTTSPYVSGDSRRYLGLMQAAVMWPIATAEGIRPPSDLAGEIVNRFRKGTKLDGYGIRVEINRTPWPAPHLIDGAWLRIPVTIPYQCTITAA